MFFRNTQPAKDVDIADLMECIRNAFDLKIAKINANANSISSRFDAETARFKKLSEQFSMKTEGPDTDLVRVSNESFVRGQKDAYAKSITTVLDSFNIVKSGRIRV